MKSAFILFVLFSGIIFSACTSQTVESQKSSEDQKLKTENQTKQLVLVELFTSEGWSSCPSADRALAFLQKEQPVGGAEIVALALHVDYWNRLGWTDEFSSPLFSQRQEFYAQKFKLGSVYTPQMVVDGNSQFVGSNLGEANKSIADSSKNQKARVEIFGDGDKLRVKISDIPAHEQATVFWAIAENNLTTNVRRGENSGKTLEHTAVVRELKAVGVLNPQEKSFESEIVLQSQTGWKRENLKAVVFVQENGSRKIFGIGSFIVDKR